MKFSFACLLSSIMAVTAVSAANTHSTPITMASSGLRADSDLGQNLLARARRVEQQQQDDQVDMTWVGGYSIKFQGCHTIQQWNDEVEDQYDVRIESKRLVKFRLCPSSSCSASRSTGCKSGYGDYIIDVNSFMDAYFEASRRATEYECDVYLNNNCDCEDNDDKGDDFNREICEYQCFVDAKLDASCVDRNPYEDDQQRENEFDPEQYMECAQYKVGGEGEDDKKRMMMMRHLEENNNNNQQQQYYVGPYCSNQGGSVLLGMFTDDTCTTFADSNGGRTTFENMAGIELPYSKVSLITNDCVSCTDQEAVDNNAYMDDDGKYEDEVMEACTTIYETAGKCETNLGLSDDPNLSSCSYIAGLSTMDEQGFATVASKGHAGLTFFTFLFAALVLLLGYYVLLLRKRLRAKHNAVPLL